MTDSTSSVDPKRDASPVSASPVMSSPVTSQPQRSGSAPSSSSSPKVEDPSRSGSKTTEILKAASAGLPSTSHAASGASHTSTGTDRSQQHGNDGARDGSSRKSGRDEGTVNAVRSLISSFEQIMKEIPRGAAARFDGVTDELAKARKSLDQGSHAPQANAPGQPSGSPKPMAASPQSHSQGSGSGRDRTANLKDDSSSDKPSAPAAL